MDKNGKQIKTGDVVVITGSYYKSSNGTYRVAHSPGDKNWSGTDYSLRKINKDGSEVEKYGVAFWPLSLMSNNCRKNREAKAHNAEHANIEIIDFQPVEKKKPQKGVKFMYNGLKVDGKLLKGRYSLRGYQGYPPDTVVLRADSYGISFPQVEGVTIENNTDSQIDYFEKDKMFIPFRSPYYAKALEAYHKQRDREGF